MEWNDLVHRDASVMSKVWQQNFVVVIALRENSAPSNRFSQQSAPLVISVRMARHIYLAPLVDSVPLKVFRIQPVQGFVRRDTIALRHPHLFNRSNVQPVDTEQHLVQEMITVLVNVSQVIIVLALS
jgi:hypothetical protein